MDNANKSEANILIIGSTGKTGRRVVERLNAMGIAVREGSRSAILPFDWEAQETWLPCLQGMKSVYLTFFPDLAVPTAPESIKVFCKLAKSNGVQQITLLSGRGEAAAQACEEILRNSEIDWTIVRSSWFAQNFSEGFFREYIMSGVLAFPINSVKEPFIDIDDIAEIVVNSLTQNGHAGKLYEVTGPELLTFSDLAHKFSKHLNNPVRFIEISMDEFVSTLKEVKVPEDAIEMLKYLFVEVLDGRNEKLSNGVEQALGRKPRSFDQFIKNNLDHF